MSGWGVLGGMTRTGVGLHSGWWRMVAVASAPPVLPLGDTEYGRGFHQAVAPHAAHLAYGMGPGFMGSGMWVGGLLWLFFLVALVAVVALIARAIFLNRSHPRDTTANPDTALQILDERYARGEIGRDEYLAKRRDLGR